VLTRRKQRFSCGLIRVSCEERGAFVEEESELVVVDPVAGVGDFDQAAIGDGLVARVVFGDGRKLSRPQKKRTGLLIWRKSSMASSMW